jgi:hypothetical protein
VAERLDSEAPEAAVGGEALERYRTARLGGEPPPERLVARLRRLVDSLPAYSQVSL